MTGVSTSQALAGRVQQEILHNDVQEDPQELLANEPPAYPLVRFTVVKVSFDNIVKFYAQIEMELRHDDRKNRGIVRMQEKEHYNSLYKWQWGKAGLNAGSIVGGVVTIVGCVVFAKTGNANTFKVWSGAGSAISGISQGIAGLTEPTIQDRNANIQDSQREDREFSENMQDRKQSRGKTIQTKDTMDSQQAQMLSKIAGS